MKLVSCDNCGVVVDMDKADSLKNPMWEQGHGPKDLKWTQVHKSAMWDGDCFIQTWTCRVCNHDENLVASD